MSASGGIASVLRGSRRFISHASTSSFRGLSHRTEHKCNLLVECFLYEQSVRVNARNATKLNLYAAEANHRKPSSCRGGSCLVQTWPRFLARKNVTAATALCS